MKDFNLLDIKETIARWPGITVRGPTVKNPDGYRDLGRSQPAGEALEWNN